MTFAFFTSCLHKNRAFVALSVCSTNHNSSKEINNHSALPPSPEEPVSASKTSNLSEHSATPSPSITFYLMPKYFEDKLQRIFKAILKARTSAVAASLLKHSWKRSLKARYPDLYQDRTYIECYNLYQPCKDYFAIIRAKSLNHILFTTSFLWDQDLFCWQ